MLAAPSFGASFKRGISGGISGKISVDYGLWDELGDFQSPGDTNFNAARINLILHTPAAGSPPDHADPLVEYWYLMPGSTINQSTDPTSGKNNTSFWFSRMYDMAESQTNAYQRELHCATSGDCILANDGVWGGGSANALGDEAVKLWRGSAHDGPEFLPTGTVDTGGITKADANGDVTLGSVNQVQRIGENNYLVYTEATPTEGSVVTVTVSSVAAPVWTASGADLSAIGDGDSSDAIGQYCFSLDNATYQGTSTGDSLEWLPVIAADDGADTFTTGYYRNGVNQGWPLQYPDDGDYTAAGTFRPCDKISDFTFDTPPTTANVNNPGSAGINIVFAGNESSDPGCTGTLCDVVAATGLAGADWASAATDTFDIVPGGPSKGMFSFFVTHQRLRGNSDTDDAVGVFRVRGNRAVRQFFKFEIQTNDTRDNASDDAAVDYMAQAGLRIGGNDVVDRVIEVDEVTAANAMPTDIIYIDPEDTVQATEDICILAVEGVGATCELNWDASAAKLTGVGLGGGVTVETAGATDVLTVAEMDDGMFIASFATGPMVYTLPAVTAGQSACFYDEEGDGITIDLDASDVINLNGTPQAAGVSIDSPAAAGDSICVLGIDTTTWITLNRVGTWIQTP